MKFLGTINTKKLDLNHEPRLRRTSFFEWISQLEVVFSSNKYIRTILANNSVNNKFKSISDKRVDLLVYTVVYAFLDKATRISTSGYKSQGTKLLKVLHMKCASIDEYTKLMAELAFTNCRVSHEETTINYLTRIEQRANEARNFDIKTLEKRFIWILLNNRKFNKHSKERIASFLTAFELNSSSTKQKWIKNKLYSMDEERMIFHRQRIFKKSARFTNTSNRNDSYTNRNKHASNNKVIRCKYCYSTGHIYLPCPDKKTKKAPSMHF